MFVWKRDGRREEVSYDKITQRNKNLSRDLSVDTVALSQTVIKGLITGMSTKDIDQLSCESAIHRSIYEPDYGILAARIAWDNLHKTTPSTFKETIMLLYKNVNHTNLAPNPLISKNTFEFAMKHIEKIESCIDYSKDYDYSYFAFRMLEKSYLQKVNGEIVERAQSMLMRVALGIYGPSDINGVKCKGNIEKALACYKEMSEKKFTPATPTLFNSGTNRPQNSSCFLLSAPDSMGEDKDDEESIPECWKHCAKISKFAGGIGVDITPVRSRGAYISGTNGRSNGIIPLVRVFNEIGRYVDQCFHPETIVFTEDGPCEIRDVCVGDKVVTHDGSLKEVLEIKGDLNIKATLYGIETDVLPTLWCTSYHPLLVIEDQKIASQEYIKNKLDSGILKPEYVEVSKLQGNEFLSFPIPTYIKDQSLTEEDCRMYGIILRKGQYNSFSHSIELEGREFTFDTRLFISSYLLHKNTPIEKDNGESISFTCSHFFPFNEKMLYRNSDKIIHKNFLHLPKNKLLAFLQGVIDGGYDIERRNIILSSIYSKYVREGIKYIALRLGVLASSEDEEVIIPLSEELCKLVGLIYAPQEQDWFRYKDVIYCQIRGIQVDTKYRSSEGPLVDLVVSENSNYLTSSGIAHNGGGKRKGAISIYLQPWHPDTPEFLELRLNTGSEELKARDIFPALWIPDLFFKRLEKDEDWSFFCPGTYPELVELYGNEFEKRYIELEEQGKMVRKIKSHELWEKILRSLIETGLPYMLAKDHINRKSNQKNIGAITSSNLCVAPETLILTETGYYPIKELEGKNVKVWNGKEWSESIVHKTNDNSELLKLYFSNGTLLECTSYHKFYLEGDIVKTANELDVSDKLLQCTFPVIDAGEKELKYAYTTGFWAGSYVHRGAGKEPLIILLDVFAHRSQNLEYKEKIFNNSGETFYYLHPDIQLTVPLNYSINTRLRFLEGLWDSSLIPCSGVVLREDFDYIKKVQLLLQTLGVDSRVEREEGHIFLKISPRGLSSLKSMGFSPLLNIEVSYFYEENLHVVAVERTGRWSETYCFNEPLQHKGVFNGILTGNCTEIMEYHTPSSIAVCNLSSIALPKFVKDGKFDFSELGRITEMVTENLNSVIDRNYFPVKYCSVNNLSYRPIGIGVQGLADVFALLGYSWESVEAKRLNQVIFEHIYFYALKRSSELAQEQGSYNSFKGSPASLGILQYDMWNVLPITSRASEYPELDWEELKKKVQKGLRNSLLIAPMPTASTSHILDNNESFEPFTSNIYARKVMAGDFPLTNKHLYRELSKIGKWNKNTVDRIIKDGGSVQKLDVPEKIKELFKTAWEIPQKVLIDMASDRGAFIDQSQSLNIYMARPHPSKLSSMYIYAWKKGLKTLSYYLRSQPAVDAIKFNIMDISDPTKQIKQETVCTDDVCVTCSS